MDTIVGWRGQEIVGARSRGSAEFWARDWRDMVLEPSGEILAKARETAGRAASWFSPVDLALLNEVDGRCCFLQSLKSEDTVTWAAFGAHVPDRVLSALLDLAYGGAERSPTWTRAFWRRYQHPDTHQPRGPEPDLVLDAPQSRFVIEAKWLADLDDKQGADRKTGQLEMRCGIAREIEDASKRGVLVIAPGPSQYAFSHQSAFARYFEADGETYRPLPEAVIHEARAVTWEQVTDTIEHELGDVEVVRYLRWRLSQLAHRS